MRINKLIAAIIVMLLALALAGCGAKPAGDQKPQNAPEAGQKAEASNPLSEIAAKVKNVEGMSFDLVMKSGSINTNGKGWVQGRCTRMEMMVVGQQVVMIMDEKGVYYSYTPGTNMAVRMKTSQGNETPADYAKKYEDPKYKVKVVESASYDGAPCKVVSIMNAQGKEESRMWVREDYGLPVKIEAESAGEKVTIEYKNLKVGPQPKELFTLPAGMQITDAPSQ